MPDVNILSASAIQALRADHERLRLEVMQMQQQLRMVSQTAEPGAYEVGMTDGTDGISAMGAGLTPGSGSVSLYRVRADGTLVDLNWTQTCYTLSHEGVGSGEFVPLWRDAWGKLWTDPSATKSQKYLFCRFTLDAALTTSDSTQDATLDMQWGYGVAHAYGTITVNNLETHTSGTYVFEGDSGDAGIAVYSGSGTTWFIIQMECP